MAKFKVEYFDEIEATNFEEAKSSSFISFNAAPIPAIPAVKPATSPNVLFIAVPKAFTPTAPIFDLTPTPTAAFPNPPKLFDPTAAFPANCSNAFSVCFAAAAVFFNFAGVPKSSNLIPTVETNEATFRLSVICRS